MVVHPQSLVHSLVEFRDGSWLAQLSVNDMVFPVQYALSWPERWGNSFPRLSPTELGAPRVPCRSTRRSFPTVALARRALLAGASAPAVLNGANEVAVGAFLAGRATFPAIAATVGGGARRARGAGGGQPRRRARLGRLGPPARRRAAARLTPQDAAGRREKPAPGRAVSP